MTQPTTLNHCPNSWGHYTISQHLPSFKDLDTPHFVFLNMLVQRPSWTREEVESIATPLRLMASGALERINEIAFEICDEPVFEGEEPLEVNIALIKEMLA